MAKYLGIEIDYERDKDLDDFALALLSDKYCTEYETSPQQAYARTAVCYCEGDMELAQRIYEYASKHWISFATPVMANAVAPGEDPVGLPISCFLTKVDDDLESLIDHSSEIRWMSVRGGGVGGHWSDVRSLSKKAPGVIPFLRTIDADMSAYHQGESRRGSYAAYLDISHPDIVEFIKVRTPTGDAQRKCLSYGFHTAINITDKFMRAVRNDRPWNLIDPHDGLIRGSMQARELWEQILETRIQTGEPYMLFSDHANDALPQILKDRGLKIEGSNLCIEIMLPTSKDRSAVCCLSSMNAAKYYSWVETRAVADMTTFLDNVLTFFIRHAPATLEKAKRSAIAQRDLGLGMLGLHTLYQQEGIAFGSEWAYELNRRIFEYVAKEAKDQSNWLARDRGPCGDAAEVGQSIRNMHVLAVAPNANSAINVMVSPSIEPINSNAYNHKTRIGTFLVKNKQLEGVLSDYGKNTEEVWSSIKLSKGSVQHLDFLTDDEKEVYLTAHEIDQRDIIQQAAQRQDFICQGQSLNLFFKDKVDKDYVSEVHFMAWSMGIKGLYYSRGEAASYAKVGGSGERVSLDESSGICEACEG